MTDASTTPAPAPTVAEAIAERLTAALSPTRLEVVNDSARHRGHMGDDGTGESHFHVTVESAAFAGQSRVARQRMVNHALADLLAERIHALAISARAPGEGARRRSGHPPPPATASGPSRQPSATPSGPPDAARAGAARFVNQASRAAASTAIAGASR